MSSEPDTVEDTVHYNRAIWCNAWKVLAVMWLNDSVMELSSGLACHPGPPPPHPPDSPAGRPAPALLPPGARWRTARRCHKRHKSSAGRLTSPRSIRSTMLANSVMSSESDMATDGDGCAAERPGFFKKKKNNNNDSKDVEKHKTSSRGLL